MIAEASADVLRFNSINVSHSKQLRNIYIKIRQYDTRDKNSFVQNVSCVAQNVKHQRNCAKMEGNSSGLCDAGPYIAKRGIQMDAPLCSACQESLAEFAAIAANKIKSILRRGVYTTQNTI